MLDDFVRSLQLWGQRHIDLPAIVYLVLLGVVGLIMHRIQSNPQNGFDWANMFLDDNNKVSSNRFFGFICMITCTWVIMYMLVHSKDHTIPWEYFLGYAAVFSGLKSVDKLIDAWALKSGGRPPPSTPPAPDVAVSVAVAPAASKKDKP